MKITKALQSSLIEELATAFYRYLKSSNGLNPNVQKDGYSAGWDAGYYIGLEESITMTFGGEIANQIGDDARKEAYRRYALLNENKENQA